MAVVMAGPSPPGLGADKDPGVGGESHPTLAVHIRSVLGCRWRGEGLSSNGKGNVLEVYHMTGLCLAGSRGVQTPSTLGDGGRCKWGPGKGRCGLGDK